ncbi:MAG: YggU family protein [Deltaproteobacteria bacterium]|nr:YggU family protein [Deltaproteobacteria bacterium]
MSPAAGKRSAAFLSEEKSGACLLELWVQPGAARDACCGMHGERLKIRLSAPPVDGKANKALIAFLCRVLDLRPGRVELVAGRSARGKTVRVHGRSAGEILAALGLVPQPPG